MEGKKFVLVIKIEGHIQDFCAHLNTSIDPSGYGVDYNLAVIPVYHKGGGYSHT